MMALIWCIPAFILGAFAGALVMALMVTASRTEKEDEKITGK